MTLSFSHYKVEDPKTHFLAEGPEGKEKAEREKAAEGAAVMPVDYRPLPSVRLENLGKKEVSSQTCEVLPPASNTEKR